MRRYLALVGLLLAGLVSASTINWEHPTERVDGSPLSVEEIAGYEIYCNDELVSGDSPVTGTSWETSVLEPGTYQCTARTVDTDGLRSSHSQSIEVIVDEEALPAPGQARNFTARASAYREEPKQMTQYFFSADDPNILDEFERLFGSGSLSVDDDNGTTVLRISGFNTWFAFDNIGQVGDAELTARMRVETVASNERAGVFVRGADVGDSYASFASVTSNTRIIRFDGGDRNTLTNNSLSGHDNTLYHERRFRITGDFLQHKTWQVTREQVFWTNDTTNTVLPGPGYIGIQNWADSGALYEWIGVGLDGDQAPTGPQRQYFWTAEDYNVNDVPDDAWSAGNRVSGFTIQEDSENRKYIDVTRSDSGLAILRFTPSGNDLGPNFELLMEFEGEEGQLAVFARGSGLTTEGDETFQAARYVRLDGIIDADQTIRYENGSPAGAESVNFPDTIDRGERGFVRVRMNGRALQARYWRATESEPTEWQINGNDIQIPDAGEVGIAFIAGEMMKIYSLGVGGNGWAAPDEPLPDGEPALDGDLAQHTLTSTEPELAHEYNIGADSSAHAHTAQESEVSIAQLVESDNAAHGHTADETTVTHAYSLDSESAAHNHAADTANVAHEYQANADNSAHTHTVEDGAVAHTYTVESDNATHGHIAGQADIAHEYEVDTENAAHAHTAQTAELTESAIIAGDNAAHTTTSQEAEVLFFALVSPSEASHGHTAEVVDITEAAVLAADNTSHAVLGQNVDISPVGVAVPTKATHAHNASEPAVFAAYDVETDSAQHSHTADSTEASFATIVASDSATHAHAAQTADLEEAAVLSIDSAAHAHTSSPAQIGFAVDIDIDSANHTHVATAPDVDLFFTIAPNTAAHTSTVSEPALDVTWVLNADKSEHVLLSDTPFIIFGEADVPNRNLIQIAKTDRFIGLGAQQKFINIDKQNKFVATPRKDNL